jgi:hypothetical protein
MDLLRLRPRRAVGLTLGHGSDYGSQSSAQTCTGKPRSRRFESWGTGYFGQVGTIILDRDRPRLGAFNGLTSSGIAQNKQLRGNT